MAKRLKNWLDEFVEHGADPKDVGEWPKHSGTGDVDWDDIENKPDFASVATSGDYNDLNNKPVLAPVAESGDYNDLENKPEIPSVGNATITIKQGGVVKGTFTTNQTSDAAIELDAGGGGGGGDYTPGDGIKIVNDEISVDRDNVQKKLVAGDNIAITPNNDNNTETISVVSTLTEEDIADLFSKYLDSNASFEPTVDPETGDLNYMLNIPRNALFETNQSGYTLVVDTDDAYLENNTAVFGEN